MRKFTIATAIAALVLIPVSTQAQAKDMVTTAVEAGSLSTLAAALDAADLVGVLQGDGPFTVFAPNDAAFAKLPEGTVEALLSDKEALTRILTYHVVPGRVTSDAVVNISEAGTVAGINAPIEVKMGEVYVAGAKVIHPDILASNGIIHVIENVMLPPAH